MQKRNSSIQNFLFFAVAMLFLFAAQGYAQSPQGNQLYVLAAPFTTVTDSISLTALRSFDPTAIPERTMILAFEGAESEESLLADFSIAQLESRVIHYATIEASVQAAVRTGRWIILPFDKLDPRLKVIAIDGISPFDKDFMLHAQEWPLVRRQEKASDSPNSDENERFANYQPEKISDVMLTGVTALVRAVSSYMDGFGPEFPAVYTGDYLRSADILHINNEVPFALVCQQTHEQLDQLVFCSKEKYIELLKAIDTSVVEIDGDHFQDFGDEAVDFTMNLYERENLPTYGGGRTLAEAQEPVLLEHNGNRFAFLGCNGKEEGYAAASATKPGAAHCDYPLMEQKIRSLKDQGYQVIVTLQHIEYYKVKPNDQMMDEYGRLADAGAVIVSGSQSHMPMAFNLSADRVIHYGLGNLFFDQAYFLPETTEATIDRYIFYDNRLLGVEIATIKFINLAQNDWMTQEERSDLLQRIFAETVIQ